MRVTGIAAYGFRSILLNDLRTLICSAATDTDSLITAPMRQHQKAQPSSLPAPL
jgi:hypothetical protein